MRIGAVAQVLVFCLPMSGLVACAGKPPSDLIPSDLRVAIVAEDANMTRHSNGNRQVSVEQLLDRARNTKAVPGGSDTDIELTGADASDNVMPHGDISEEKPLTAEELFARYMDSADSASAPPDEEIKRKLVPFAYENADEFPTGSLRSEPTGRSREREAARDKLRHSLEAHSRRKTGAPSYDPELPPLSHMLTPSAGPSSTTVTFGARSDQLSAEATSNLRAMLANSGPVVRLTAGPGAGLSPLDAFSLAEKRMKKLSAMMPISYSVENSFDPHLAPDTVRIEASQSTAIGMPG